jgi:hypothetical protein
MILTYSDRSVSNSEIGRQLTQDQPPTNSGLRESTGFSYAARIEGARLATMVTNVKSAAATATVTEAQRLQVEEQVSGDHAFLSAS